MTMLKKQLSIKRKFFIGLMKGLMYLSAGLTAALVLFLVSYVLIKGIPGITWQLLSTEPSYLSDTIGILPDPFSMKIEEETNPGIRALQRASRIAEEYGISDMTLEEINAEIAEARK